MSKEVIPACYFPCTVMLISDKQSFITKLARNLHKSISYKIYNSTRDALHNVLTPVVYHDNENNTLSTITGLVQDTRKPYTNFSIEDSSDAISHEVYNPHRFEDIAVVVIDCDMPEINFKDYIEKAERLAVKWILLTSKAESQNFNVNDLGLRIRKQQPNLGHIVSTAIKQMLTNWCSLNM